MRKLFPLWMRFVFLGCLFFLQTSPALADPIPNISITSATGSAVWGGNIGGGANASLSGPDFTLNFSGFYPPAYTYAFPGSAFGGDSGSLPLHEVVGAADIPGGTLTIGGITNGVVYDGSIEASPLGTGIVPSGSATIILPAVLTSNGFFPVCLANPAFSNCTGTATINPIFVANVNFDVPGLLTYNFTSLGVLGGTETEQVTATFTPTPEPATAVLLRSGLMAGLASVTFCFRTERKY